MALIENFPKVLWIWNLVKSLLPVVRLAFKFPENTERDTLKSHIIEKNVLKVLTKERNHTIPESVKKLSPSFKTGYQ